MKGPVFLFVLELRCPVRWGGLSVVTWGRPSYYVSETFCLTVITLLQAVAHDKSLRVAAEVNSITPEKSSRTFVPPQPSLKAASWANSSPKPSIMPLMNGSNRLMAAPRNNDQTVGGLYRMTGEPEEGGEVDSSSPGEYCSLSECIVMPDSARWLVASSEAMVAHCEAGDRSCGLWLTSRISGVFDLSRNRRRDGIGGEAWRRDATLNNLLHVALAAYET